MNLIQPRDSDCWHVEVVTENGSTQTVNTGCRHRAEAEAVVRQARIPESETASKAHRLTAEVVTLITANRNLTVDDAIAEWDAWMEGAARSTHSNQQPHRGPPMGSRDLGGPTCHRHDHHGRSSRLDQAVRN